MDDAEKASAGHRVLTVVDEAFELVAERVLYVGAAGSLVDWSLGDEAEGPGRHVLAPPP